MLTYLVVNIIAFSFKIMIRKIFFISQHFFSFLYEQIAVLLSALNLHQLYQKFSTGKEKRWYTLQIQQQKAPLKSLEIIDVKNGSFRLCNIRSYSKKKKVYKEGRKE